MRRSSIVLNCSAFTDEIQVSSGCSSILSSTCCQVKQRGLTVINSSNRRPELGSLEGRYGINSFLSRIWFIPLIGCED